MLGMGCPHPSFHNSYPVATHDIPNPPIVTEEGLAAAGYRQYDRIIPEDLWARLAELATVELNPSMLEEVDLQSPGEGGGRYQTTVSSVPHWLPDDLWQAVLALLGFSLPPLEGLEALCPKIIERWEAEPWRGFEIPHRDFALSVKQSLQCMVVFIPLTTSPPSKSLQVCPGTQGGYHAANLWDIVIQPLRSVTLLRGVVIHRGAGGPGRALFILFAPVGYRSRMLTVEPGSVTELMNSVPVMPSELLAEGAAAGSPLGTEASLNYSPLDQGSEEADPVPAPQEEDMLDAPADAEERPAAPADADAAPPPPESAADEDVLTTDAIPQPVCFVSQVEQPLDPPLPYMGDVLLLQEGMFAGLVLTPTDHAHVGPTAKAARADACLTPRIHRWWLPPPRGHRLVPLALHGRHGGVLVRRTWRRVRAGARGRPHGLDGHGPLHAAPELPWDAAF